PHVKPNAKEYSVAEIVAANAREILDSRGSPTVEVEVLLAEESVGRAGVPSGASTGEFEAGALRDGGPERYLGKGVTQAVDAVVTEVHEAIVGLEGDDQRLVDRALNELDVSDNWSRLRAHPMLGSSLLVARAAAVSAVLPLYRYFVGPNAYVMSVPLMNILSGD